MSIARRAFLIGLGLAGLFAATARAEPQPAAVGSVEATLGDCTARQRGGEMRHLKAGSTIYMNDIVLTGGDGRLDLKLGASTRIFMHEQNRLFIDAFMVGYGGQIDLPRAAPFALPGGDAPAVAAPLQIIAPRG